MQDDYIEVRAGEPYSKVTQFDGVKTTVCLNRFEIACNPLSEVNEQQAVQQLREWLKKRREEELQRVGSLSE